MGNSAERGPNERELRARAATAIDLAGALAGLERVSDIYDELEEVAERRRLLATCLHHLVVREGSVELHVPAYPTIVVRLGDDLDGIPDVSAPSATG